MFLFLPRTHNPGFSLKSSHIYLSIYLLMGSSPGKPWRSTYKDVFSLKNIKSSAIELKYLSDHKLKGECTFSLLSLWINEGALLFYQRLRGISWNMSKMYLIDGISTQVQCLLSKFLLA